MSELVREMIAMVAPTPGGPDVLTAVRRPVPTPGPGQVLLRVAAAGVNRPDLMQRSGAVTLPPGTTDILGLEAAGTVAAVGHGVRDWQCGQRVMALLDGGGYADHCLAQADLCLPVPESMDWDAAAALPEGAFTVWHNLFERGRLQPGETVLIHGGASGIGTLATQLARATGARVLATVGSDEKAVALQALGAIAINHRTTDFVQAALAHTADRGVDVVLDIVGGAYLPRNLEALAPEGRHVSISFMQSPEVGIDLRVVMRKGLTLTSSTMRPKPAHEKARIARAVRAHVLPLVASGQVAPVVHARLPLAHAAQAHALLEGSTHIGKVVLDTSLA